MSEPLENWMLNTPILRMSATHEHSRVMFVAQGRMLFRGKRQHVALVKKTRSSRSRVWRISDIEGDA